MRALSSLLLLVVALTSCEDDAPAPESVPFEGLDPAVQPKRPKAAPDPEPEPSASASAPAPAPRKPSANTGRLSACCAALAAVGKTSPDASQRTAYTSASRVCFTKISEVKQGKLTTAIALSQVRSSILGTAPGACR